MNIHVFDDPQETVKQLTSQLETILNLSISDQVNIAISGGSTPRLWFEYLSIYDSNTIQWDRIHFFWVDERCVSPEDDDSNFKMTRERLLSRIDIPEENIHRIMGEADPEDEAKRYGKEISHYLPEENGLPRFDLVQLGVGDDGHTASIFPDKKSLLKSKDIVSTATHPESGQKRITLTGPVINNANNIAFLVNGENKAKILAEIIKKHNQDLPATHIKAENGTLHWFWTKKQHL